jgi:membrane protease YdiL (CAAX protease family)
MGMSSSEGQASDGAKPDEGRWPIASGRRLAHALALALLQPVVPVVSLVFLGPLLFDNEGGLREPTLLALLAVAAAGGIALALLLGPGLLIAGRISLSALGFRRIAAPRAALLSLAGAAVCVAAIFLGLALFGEAGAPASVLDKLASYSPLQRALFIVLGLQIALYEETIFRGYLQPTLTAKLGVAGGLVLTAVLYAVYHPPHFHLVGIVARLLQGLTYGVLRESSRSLVPSTFAHALYWAVFGLT